MHLTIAPVPQFSHKHLTPATSTDMRYRAGSKASGAITKRLPRRGDIVTIDVDPALEEAFLAQRDTAREVQNKPDSMPTTLLLTASATIYADLGCEGVDMALAGGPTRLLLN